MEKKKLTFYLALLLNFFLCIEKKQLADTSLKSLKHDQVKKIKHYHNLD